MKSKEVIAIIKESRNPLINSFGLFAKEPTPAQLRKNIPVEVQRNIWIAAFKDLQIMNWHYQSVMPMLLAYSQEMASYFILKNEAGEEVVKKRRDDDVINPVLVQANRHYQNAMNAFKLLGLDPRSRLRIPRGPDPVNPRKKVKKGEFDEL